MAYVKCDSMVKVALGCDCGTDATFKAVGKREAIAMAKRDNWIVIEKRKDSLPVVLCPNCSKGMLEAEKQATILKAQAKDIKEQADTKLAELREKLNACRRGTKAVDATDSTETSD